VLVLLGMAMNNTPSRSSTGTTTLPLLTVCLSVCRSMGGVPTVTVGRCFLANAHIFDRLELDSFHTAE